MLDSETAEGIATLTLIRKEEIAPRVMSFWFEDEPALEYMAGQYLQCSLPHPNPDERGTRRLFTICSAPTEEHVMITVKVPQTHSSFKETMQTMPLGTTLAVLGVRGNFVLPANEERRLAFLAGGIGITPYRSMIKYLLDASLSRDAVLLYGNRRAEEVIFTDLFREAREAFGLKTVYVLADASDAPLDWPCYEGTINAAMIEAEMPDYRERLFFICGSLNAVLSLEQMLLGMGINRNDIKRDYFPGYG